MKTVAILIPTESYGEVRAIIETSWNCTRYSMFMQVLKEYGEASNELFSLEIFHYRQATTLYITAHKKTIDIINGALYGIFPNIVIEEREDFTQIHNPENWDIASAEITTRETDVIPLKDATQFKVDSLTPLLTTLARMPYDGMFMVQFVCSPIKDSSLTQAKLKKDSLMTKISHVIKPKFWVKEGGLEKRFSGMEEKVVDNMLGVSARMCALLPKEFEYTKSPEEYLRMMLKGGYTECNSSALNKLLFYKPMTGHKALQCIQDREFIKPIRLTPKELATLWHLPDLSEGTTLEPVISKKKNAPAVTPLSPIDPNVSVFAENRYREKSTLFGIHREDRAQHMYIVGQTGTGKSKLFELLTKCDLVQGQGLAVIDPHGDLVDNILRYVPENRAEDVVLIDPLDSEYPVSFNPVAQVPEREHAKVAATLVESLKKVLARHWSESMGRLIQKSIESILTVHGSTLETILKMLSSTRYREWIVSELKNKDLIAYWKNEYPALCAEHDEDVIAPLLCFLGELLAPDPIHDMLCQPLNKINFREIIDNKKILLIKLPKGILGDSAASLLGSLFLTRIYQSALTRSDLNERQRHPFYLYIDEFHNFTTRTLNEMLTEARKFGLHMTLSNQFLSQIVDETRTSLLSNVGTIISMKVGGEDATVLENVFGERVGTQDLINLALREFAIKMPVRGESQEAFTGRTLDIISPQHHYADLCRLASRSQYALPAEDVSDMVSTWSTAA